MERKFANENMEEFLRRNVEGLRMRPSSGVWKGISSHLNRRKRRIGFFLGTSLLLLTGLGYYFVNEYSNNNQIATVNSNTKIETKISKQIASAHQEASKLLLTHKTQTNKDKSFSEANTIFNEQSISTQTLFERNEVTVQNSFEPTVVDSYMENEWTSEKKPSSLEQYKLADPLSIESVLNSYKPKSRKLGWQFYFTPTVSYRKLSDNTIDNIMPHKPAFGFELGTTAKYPVAKNVKLRAGFQFNVNRYEIKTWDSYTQLATIRLVDKNGVDYVRTVTNYNNFSGYKTNWLQNFSLQVSAPVGVELKLTGDDKVQFGVASTVQPTYVLGDKAYLISADYKNYTEMPSLVRRWNVNTSLETFVAYSTGHLNWQVGPQVRYQILSSYLKKYPIKEHLFDFGLKVGISVNNKQ